MQVGMTMPVMEPGLDASVVKAWAATIDDGPFSSLCWGERIAFDNPDSLTLLGALGAWTERVQLVMPAKALATGDMPCDGRLTVGFGVGERHEDYRAVGADPATRTLRGFADVGTDEMHLIPTSSDLDQVRRVADVVKDFA